MLGNLRLNCFCGIRQGSPPVRQREGVTQYPIFSVWGEQRLSAQLAIFPHLHGFGWGLMSRYWIWQRVSTESQKAGLDNLRLQMVTKKTNQSKRSALKRKPKPNLTVPRNL
jgi:hypothetical protein